MYLSQVMLSTKSIVISLMIVIVSISFFIFRSAGSGENTTKPSTQQTETTTDAKIPPNSSSALSTTTSEIIDREGNGKIVRTTTDDKGKIVYRETIEVKEKITGFIKGDIWKKTEITETTEKFDENGRLSVSSSTTTEKAKDKNGNVIKETVLERSKTIYRDGMKQSTRYYDESGNIINPKTGEIIQYKARMEEKKEKLLKHVKKGKTTVCQVKIELALDEAGKKRKDLNKITIGKYNPDFGLPLAYFHPTSAAGGASPTKIILDQSNGGYVGTCPSGGTVVVNIQNTPTPVATITQEGLVAFAAISENDSVMVPSENLTPADITAVAMENMEGTIAVSHTNNDVIVEAKSNSGAVLAANDRSDLGWMGGPDEYVPRTNLIGPADKWQVKVTPDVTKGVGASSLGPARIVDSPLYRGQGTYDTYTYSYPLDDSALAAKRLEKLKKRQKQDAKKRADSSGKKVASAQGMYSGDDWSLSNIEGIDTDTAVALEGTTEENRVKVVLDDEDLSEKNYLSTGVTPSPAQIACGVGNPACPEEEEEEEEENEQNI